MASASQTPRLTQEQLQRSIERLTRSRREDAVLRPTVPPRSISREALTRQIRHLYDDSLDHRRSAREQIVASLHAAHMRDAPQLANAAPLDAEQEEELVRRLYTKPVARRHRTQAMLQSAEEARSAPGARVLRPAEQTEVVGRLYEAAVQHEQERQVALFHKYVLSRRPQPAYAS